MQQAPLTEEIKLQMVSKVVQMQLNPLISSGSLITRIHLKWKYHISLYKRPRVNAFSKEGPAITDTKKNPTYVFGGNAQ